MIREANIRDAERIAEIDAAGSRYAYEHILPEEQLSGLSAQARLPVCTRWLTERLFDVYVYEDGTGNVLGMMGTGMCEDEDKHDAFELHFIYVDPCHVRKGIGSELLRFFEQKGSERGCTESVVWVLEENIIGRSFYDKHGYIPDGKDKIFMRWNKREIRYTKQAEPAPTFGSDAYVPI